jgi:hypothetical protein
MFKKLLIKQTAGSSLKFAPGSSMGFTTGGNYASLAISSYTPGSTNAHLSFFEGTAPTESQYGSFSTNFTLAFQDVELDAAGFVNAAIEAEAVASAITYLKSFNSGCNFTSASFAAEVSPL